jgi:hypothetical protein
MNEIRQMIEAKEAEITADQAMMMAHKIIFALAEAFGGFSQVPDSLVGHAILGQANNNWAPPLSLARAAARLLSSRWEWEDAEAIYRVIAAAYNAERERLGWRHVPELPERQTF